MSYVAGVDLGTSYSGIAVLADRASVPAMATLGTRSDVVPSVLRLREDGAWAVGEAAEHRGPEDPGRIAREFKRRLGDSVPVFVGTTPMSAEALMALLLRDLLGRVESIEGTGPTRLVMTRPANWGAYRRELFDQVAQLAGVEAATETLSEPEAAALYYASIQRLSDGQTIAVYDLGGGTFDATVMALDGARPVIIGTPEGVERLGGVDFDAAVFEMVRRAAERLFDELDEEDPLALAAVAQVRDACRTAKEVLSEEAAATVIVALPTGMQSVRVTRQEFEEAVRPLVLASLEALCRAVSSAGLNASQVDRVLLVGGSSRVPMVSALLSAEFGRPVAVDANPKHAVALGAAVAARAEPASRSFPALAAPAAAPSPAPEPTEPAAPEPSGRRALDEVQAVEHLVSWISSAYVESGRRIRSGDVARLRLPFGRIDAALVVRVIGDASEALRKLIADEGRAEGWSDVDGMLVPTTLGPAVATFVEADDPPAAFVVFESIFDT
jgi:molecular chaperone DnaK (HSP70)